MTQITNDDRPGRPRPILEAIRAGAWKTGLGTLVTAAVSFGLLNTEQATAANNIVATLATVVTAVTSIVAQLHLLRHVEPQVTPVSDPRTNTGEQLVRATTGPSKG